MNSMSLTSYYNQNQTPANTYNKPRAITEVFCFFGNTSMKSLTNFDIDQL